MAIVKVKNHIESYKLKSFSESINELSGRIDNRLTIYRNQIIMNKVLSSFENVVVDIGCGDATLLNSIQHKVGIGFGIVPSSEEKDRLDKEYSDSSVFILKGLTVALPIEDEIATTVVCNGVFLLLENEDEVIKSLLEIKRVTKKDGTVWIGEVPFIDEVEYNARNYGDSILKWLVFVFRNNGYNSFFKAIQRLIRAIFFGDTFLINPKQFFFIRPEKFVGVCEMLGFEVVEILNSKILNNCFEEEDSSTRYDYILRKN
ncbi:methyltransferase domain-containing protein [Paenibacillus sp. FSL R5-0744]|uniref:methyltransferase domain-containing protein n=1 Tax=Paenibacillus sp. FSL R5-0744 TaxID=2921656 RepID=UPI0030DA674D